MNTKQEHESLLFEWNKKYAKLEDDEQIEFTYDGPIDWETWEVKKNLKILFLAKESRGEYQPRVIPKELDNSFTKNIARWRFAIKSLFERPTEKPNFPSDSSLNPKNSFSDIAIVEIKKLHENKGRSNNSEIKRYARNDKDFLCKQIDLINPHIVLCCNTQEIGYDIIYSDVEYIPISPTIEKCQCWKFGNRLVIDFYHPSIFGSHLTSQDLFSVLCNIISQGNVFDEFNWFKSE